MPNPSAVAPEILGRSPQTARARDLIERYSHIPDPILVLGATGTGKSIVARALHAKSGCRGRFVTLSGGHLVETLYHSQLFGSTRGAYTGATRDSLGAFESAHGGTLFLDELPLWSRAAQGAVLQAVEEGWVIPLGAQREIPVDCRVLFGSNQPLNALVEAGALMEDLLYRIGAFVIELPPLAQRRVDIAVFAYYYLDQEGVKSPATTPPVISCEALDALLAYGWPGNVRELRSVIRYACVQAHGTHMIGVQDLPPCLRACRGSTDPVVVREVTSWMYEVMGRDRRATARRLGVHPNTVDYRLRRRA